jgi:hypothetical protein
MDTDSRVKIKKENHIKKVKNKFKCSESIFKLRLLLNIIIQ